MCAKNPRQQMFRCGDETNGEVLAKQNRNAKYFYVVSYRLKHQLRP